MRHHRGVTTQSKSKGYLDRVFGPLGILAAEFPGYEPRKGQVDFAHAAHDAFAGGSNLLAEAGTGVGKSVGYSVPATWWAATQNDERAALGLKRQRVCIVTANIALQEQLTTKDLPRLQRLLPWKFTFALLKGIGNYLCLDRFEESTPDQLTLQGVERHQVDTIAKWRGTTKTGDLSELPFELKPRTRSLVVVSSEDCTGKACPHYEGCFSKAAKRQAAEVDVVVTNYHMFFLNLVLKLNTEGHASVLPEYELVVFDEAHKATDIAREFFGFRVTRGMIRSAARLLDAPATPKKAEVRIDRQLKDDLMGEGGSFFARLYKHARDAPNPRFTDPGIVDSKDLVALLKEAGAKFEAALDRQQWDPGRKRELGHAATKCKLLAYNVERAARLEGQGSGNVYFIELSGDNAALVMKPLSVADELRQYLFESDEVQSVVMTSATLTSSNTFDFVATELGCEDADELVAESPFDWSEQCLLVQPERLLSGKPMPMPTHPSYADAVAEAMFEVAEMSGGNMLGLFTSYRVLERAHKLFLERGWGDRLLRQGEQPRTQLVERLKEERGSVLLGTESFWAGIDVPGPALSVVVIDRLPFPSPEDPMLQAYEDIHGGKAFKQYSMPRAVIQLRQGFGRLVRTIEDRGAVVVLDRRLTEKGFGKSFLRSLPPELRVSRELGDVAKMVGSPEPGFRGRTVA